ncbi:hypothetical protein DR864_11950 [Runella rosea]|uniref:Uncharacterized protein n=1 Tax=Runella rosea TaxID=2259595 RepID=A0A344TIE1_9BACT|nr:hypothetical protein [Runella rosea]AXE18412.1 hypothetical protein DR864_11950 [Runella rosea]
MKVVVLLLFTILGYAQNVELRLLKHKCSFPSDEVWLELECVDLDKEPTMIFFQNIKYDFYKIAHGKTKKNMSFGKIISKDDLPCDLTKEDKKKYLFSCYYENQKKDSLFEAMADFIGTQTLMDGFDKRDLVEILKGSVVLSEQQNCSIPLTIISESAIKSFFGKGNYLLRVIYLPNKSKIPLLKVKYPKQFKNYKEPTKILYSQFLKLSID